jgi:hypothetical protein
MRIPVAALALSAAAASSLLLAGPAHAATNAAAAPADIPTYNCQYPGPVPPIFPPWVNGRDCTPGNSSTLPFPVGYVPGPVRISIGGDQSPWICDSADAGNFPSSALGRNCYPENQGPW